MAWVTVPNEIVRTFTGQPLKLPRLDEDFEAVCHPIRCQGCDYKTTNMREMQEHIGEHSEPLSISASVEMEEANVAKAVMYLLLRLGNPARDNPFNALRRNNDSMHSAEVWRQAYLSIKQGRRELRLKQAQYDWLHQLLDRKLPLSKEARERGEEQQTVGMEVFGWSESVVREALTTLPERRPVEDDGYGDAVREAVDHAGPLPVQAAGE